MKSVLQQLPPMSALRPFEAAARHNNFTAAAQELSVTQAAISKQIRQLEEHLGTRLFFRNGRNLELTAAGRDLHESVALGLAQIASRRCQQRSCPPQSRCARMPRLSFCASAISSSRVMVSRSASLADGCKGFGDVFSAMGVFYVFMQAK